jgi:hypothetical protein
LMPILALNPEHDTSRPTVIPLRSGDRATQPLRECILQFALYIF